MCCKGSALKLPWQRCTAVVALSIPRKQLLMDWAPHSASDCKYQMIGSSTWITSQPSRSRRRNSWLITAAISVATASIEPQCSSTQTRANMCGPAKAILQACRLFSRRKRSSSRSVKGRNFNFNLDSSFERWQEWKRGHWQQAVVTANQSDLRKHWLRGAWHGDTCRTNQVLLPR